MTPAMSRQDSAVAAEQLEGRRLISELTQLDQREEATEIRQRIRVNIYRLGHYLRAADEVMQRVATGERPEDAFADVFVPTRGMHTVARRLGLRLDVQRGQWVAL